jgi:hypothetical protein
LHQFERSLINNYDLKLYNVGNPGHTSAYLKEKNVSPILILQDFAFILN